MPPSREERYLELLEKTHIYNERFHGFFERQQDISDDFKNLLQQLVDNQKASNDQFILHHKTGDAILEGVVEIKTELMVWIKEIFKKGAKVIGIIAFLLLLAVGGNALIENASKVIPKLFGG